MSRNLHQPRSINYDTFANIKVDLADGVELTNAVAGAVIDAPVATAAWFPVQVNFTAYGAIRLPPLASIPYNYEYLFYRKAPTGNARMVQIMASGTELIDGHGLTDTSNGSVYMQTESNTSTSLRIRRAEGSWVSTGGYQAHPANNGLAVSTNLELWAGPRQIQLAGAGPLTLTFPELPSNVPGSGMPRGSSIAYIHCFSGNWTVNCAAPATFWGSVNGINYAGGAAFPLVAGQTAIVWVFSRFIYCVH